VYAPVVWNSFILADSGKLENTQRQFANICYNRFIQPNFFVIMNHCRIIYFLKHFIPDDKILTIYFSLIFSRTKLTVVLLRIQSVPLYAQNKLETFPPLTSVMSQDVALQHGASRLQTTTANLWTFSINVTSPLRTHFFLFNRTELYLYCFSTKY
jgi:hypothetical protein